MTNAATPASETNLSAFATNFRDRTWVTIGGIPVDDRHWFVLVYKPNGAASTLTAILVRRARRGDDPVVLGFATSTADEHSETLAVSVLDAADPEGGRITLRPEERPVSAYDLHTDLGWLTSALVARAPEMIARYDAALAGAEAAA